MADTFNETDKQTTGTYANDYLWSDLKNWSTGALPASTDAVTINSTASAPSIDDVALTVASLTLAAAGSLMVANTLTTGSLGGGGPITINHGGTLEVTTALSTAESFVQDGGALKLDATAAVVTGSSFTFGAAATYGTSFLYAADLADFNSYNQFSFAVNAFDVGDSIEFGTLKFTTATQTSAHVILLSSSTGTQYTLTNFKTTLASPTFSLSTAANGGTIITLNCFLAGTRIETPAGPVEIETLSVGDLVVTIEQGARVPKPIRWIGTRLVEPAGMDHALAHDAAPVRIRAAAFTDSIPDRDLLVTADHCVFDSGGLIPARMLVNGASITRETNGAAYRVYHIECETHSILISEGLTTESYLDTGGLRGFDPSCNGMNKRACWLTDAAAPLVTARAAVEPIWRRLAARAEALGIGSPPERRIRHTTTDPALQLELEDGSWLRPLRSRGGRYLFILPAGTGRATLQSRSAIPSDVEGVFVDDRRRLGVLVHRATLWSELCSTILELGAQDGTGWHQTETVSVDRWTDGRGSLSLPDLLHPTMLEIELSATLRYPLSDDQPNRLQA